MSSRAVGSHTSRKMCTVLAWVPCRKHLSLRPMAVQAEHEAALLAARDSVARPEDGALAAVTTSEADARVASQWAAAAAAALLE